MKVEIRKKLEKKDSQLLFGELEVEVKAVVKNAEEVARRTGGRVFFKRESGTLYDVLDYTAGALLIRDRVRDELEKAILNKVKEQKSKEVEIDVNELDWTAIEAEIRKMEEEERKKREQEQKEQRAKQKIKDFVARFNNEHKELKAELRSAWHGKLNIEIKGYGVSNSIYFSIDEILSDDFTYERFVALVHEKIIEHFKKLAETEKESIEKLEQENAILREFIAEHHTASELAAWLAERKKRELDEEAWDEAERLVPELFEDENEDEEEW